MNYNQRTIQLLTVGRIEVKEMLDSYDSGMSDRTTQNAVALALQKLLRPNVRLKVFNNAANGRCECRIADSKLELPRAVATWLKRAEHALPVDPISFPVLLKDKWLMISPASINPMLKEVPQKLQAA